MIIKAFVLSVHRSLFGIGADVKNPVPFSCIFLGDVEDTPTFKGKQPMKLSSQNMQIWDDFPVVPGYYDLDVSCSANGEGDMKFKLNSAKYLQQEE